MIYKCMERPCTIQTDDKLWCIVGTSKNYGSGVLAWCYDKDDAEFWFNQMIEDKEFLTLSYSKWVD